MTPHRDTDLRLAYPADGLSEEQRRAAGADMESLGLLPRASAPLPPARPPNYGLWMLTGVPPWRIREYARGEWSP